MKKKHTKVSINYSLKFNETGLFVIPSYLNKSKVKKKK